MLHSLSMECAAQLLAPSRGSQAQDIGDAAPLLPLSAMSRMLVLALR